MVCILQLAKHLKWIKFQEGGRDEVEYMDVLRVYRIRHGTKVFYMMMTKIDVGGLNVILAHAMLYRLKVRGIIKGLWLAWANSFR